MLFHSYDNIHISILMDLFVRSLSGSLTLETPVTWMPSCSHCLVCSALSRIYNIYLSSKLCLNQVYTSKLRQDELYIFHFMCLISTTLPFKVFKPFFAQANIHVVWRVFMSHLPIGQLGSGQLSFCRFSWLNAFYSF